MELVNFSVTNYRSITAAHKVATSGTTILIGKNNEGKSNILKGLNIAMTNLQYHALKSRGRLAALRRLSRKDEDSYYWERDFPISLQTRKSGIHTIFRLEFLLNDVEIEEFKNEIKSNLNGTLSIIIKIGKENEPIIEVSKQGKGSKALNTRSGRIAEFIAEKIVFNYIPAIRTDQEALNVVRRMLSQRLRVLESKQDYLDALQTIKVLQQPILEALGERIKESLVEFLPSIKNVKIEISDDVRRSSLRRDFDVIVDDGTPTNLAFKGDGVKSLAALGLLKDRISSNGTSIIAIEEPESHLHPAAIHQLNEVIMSLSENNQVILTTHNPLFVDRQDIKSNIIVDKGKATPAKDIKQIRDLLGIKASDNLVNASYVLVVEGDSDAIIMKSLLSTLSEKLEKNIKNNLLIVDPIGGAGNLSYKLTLLSNSLCVYHTFLDNDEAGRKAYETAEKDGVLSIKSNTFITCNGSSDSELEDCFNIDEYKNAVIDEFGVDLDSPRFRGSAKWSERARSTFLDQGKLWNKGVEARVKWVVSTCIKDNPKSSLNEHKRNSIDALVNSLEKMIKN
jgi:predicted ATP-dependent endonuclease of OLD family